jgi:predicted alpha/beta superfamily hydrolase
MHDGQNLFDKTTSYAGEWGVDETLNQLHKDGDYGAIVVGIDNGGAKRMDEYSPWKHERYGGGEGDEYIDFIRYTLSLRSIRNSVPGKMQQILVFGVVPWAG